MTVARSVHDVLSDHVQFAVECIDRMYVNVYVPQLQYAAGLVGYVHRRLGLPIASLATPAEVAEYLRTTTTALAHDRYEGLADVHQAWQ